MRSSRICVNGLWGPERKRNNTLFKFLKTVFSAWLTAAVLISAAAEPVPVTALESLQKENAALRDKLIAQGRELACMRQWLAGMVSGEASLGDAAPDVRFQRLETIRESGMALALKSDSAVKELRKFFRAAQVDDATRIKYLMLLDELSAAAGTFSGSIVSRDMTRMDLRVITVDNKLQIGIVSGGMRCGVFPGMMLSPVNAPESKLRLRVISVRPGACAVDLAAGEWSEVIPGMALTPFRKQ